MLPHPGPLLRAATGPHGGDLPTTTVDLTTTDASAHTATYGIRGITPCGSTDQVP